MSVSWPESAAGFAYPPGILIWRSEDAQGAYSTEKVSVHLPRHGDTVQGPVLSVMESINPHQILVGESQTSPVPLASDVSLGPSEDGSWVSLTSILRKELDVIFKGGS